MRTEKPTGRMDELEERRSASEGLEEGEITERKKKWREGGKEGDLTKQPKRD